MDTLSIWKWPSKPYFCKKRYIFCKIMTRNCHSFLLWYLVQSQILGISLYKKLNTYLTGRDHVKTHLCAVASHRVWWLINPCPAWFDRHLMPANFIQEPTTPKWPKMQLQRTLNLFRIILALGHNDRRKISG